MTSQRPRTTHDLVSERTREEVSSPDTGGGRHSLIADQRVADYEARWDQIQTDFVDEPRRAVEDAEALVDDLVRDITDTFSRERDALERQWDRGESVDTEDLRMALQRYRAFFNRLLSTQ